MNELMQDNNIRRGFLVVLVLLALFLLAQSINTLSNVGEGDFAENTIVVSGEGKVNAVPDIANFSFTVSQEEETVKEAQDKVSERISNILDALENMDIEEKDINTQSYNVYPRFEFLNRIQICPEGFSCPPSRGERTLVGYEVSQTISLKLRDLDKAGEILEALGSLEISNLNGPNFDIEDREEFEREARKMAIKEAREKAKILAKDLSVRLGKVVSFHEGGRGFIGHDFVKSESVDGVGGGFAPEIPVGEGEITSFVEIVYEIK